MPDPQSRLQAHKDDSMRVKANNHDKRRIATNKAESRMRGASVVHSLSCSPLFVLLLQPKAALSGSQTQGGKLRKQLSFYESAVVEHKAQTHFEGLLFLSGLRCAF
jgi:hypothetical protein